MNAIYSTRWNVSLERLFLHRRGVRKACFPYGNSFPMASVGYGKVALPHGKPVSAQAWGTGSMPPVREFVPVGTTVVGRKFAPLAQLYHSGLLCCCFPLPRISMLSDLGTTARGHSQDRSSHQHSHISDNIEIWGRGAGNEQVTEFGDVCSICKPEVDKASPRSIDLMTF